MGKVGIIILVLVVLGGGYYFYSQNTSRDTDDIALERKKDIDITVDITPQNNNNALEEENNDDANNKSITKYDSTTEVKEFEIVGTNFKFSMNTIEVNKGDTVKIKFINAGGFHDWSIDQFDARTAQIQAGETETIEFVADESGEFEYYCSVGNHRQLGMVGKLIVK